MKTTGSTCTGSALGILIGATTIFVSYRIGYFFAFHLATWARHDPVRWVPLPMLLAPCALWALMFGKRKS